MWQLFQKIASLVSRAPRLLSQHTWERYPSLAALLHLGESEKTNASSFIYSSFHTAFALKRCTGDPLYYMITGRCNSVSAFHKASQHYVKMVRFLSFASPHSQRKVPNVSDAALFRGWPRQKTQIKVSNSLFLWDTQVWSVITSKGATAVEWNAMLLHVLKWTVCANGAYTFTDFWVMGSPSCLFLICVVMKKQY